MALTKIPSELSSTTGIVDNSNATAITIDSNENVGIGTTTVNADLHINKSSGAKLWITAEGSNPSDAGSLRFSELSNGNNYFEFKHDGNDNNLNLTTSNGDLVTFARNNKRVGIGTTSPARILHLKEAVPCVRFEDTDASGVYHDILSEQNTGFCIRVDEGNVASGSYFKVDIDNSEKMRINSNGHLTVGTTSTDPAASGSETGVALRNGGLVSISRNDSAASVNINKIGYDGSLVDFRKGGTTVGSIGTVAGRLGIGTGDAGLFFDDDNNKISPVTMVSGTPVDSDGLLDLGYSSARFKDIYFSGGMYGNSLRSGETLPSSTDFNDLKTSGFYRVDNNATNAPNTLHHALVIYGNSSNVVTQIATSLASTTTYVRSFNSAWTSWARLDT